VLELKVKTSLSLVILVPVSTSIDVILGGLYVENFVLSGSE